MLDETKYYTVTQAAEVLGVSRWKIWKLIDAGELPAEPSPLDRRQKLIPVADVARLKQFVTGKKAAA
jgi:excisionase family DNA binding protein